MKSLVLVLLVVLVAGCVAGGPSPAETRQSSDVYTIKSCDQFSVPEIPQREYIQTGAVYASIASITQGIEAVCVGACAADNNPVEQCIRECDGIGFDPVTRYRDPYEPHEPENAEYLPASTGPHKISGSFKVTDEGPFYWEGRARFGQIQETYIVVENAELVYEGTTLKGDYVLYGAVDIRNATRTVDGNVTAIYEGTSYLNGRPLLKAAMHVDVSELCMDFKTGHNETIPFRISETSRNADAVDFKIIFVNTTEIPQGASIHLSKDRGIAETIFTITKLFVKSFTLLVVYSDREYDTLPIGSSETWRLNVLLPSGTTESFGGIIYVRADNAAGFVIPVVINPT